MDKCNICKKKIVEGTNIKCLSCKMYYHIRCIAYQNDTPNSFTDPWYCHICITNALPFNNILLDDDFHSILAEIFNAHIPMPLEELQSKIFNPFEISENEKIPLCMI